MHPEIRWPSKSSIRASLVKVTSLIDKGVLEWYVFDLHHSFCSLTPPVPPADQARQGEKTSQDYGQRQPSFGSYYIDYLINLVGRQLLK